MLFNHISDRQILLGYALFWGSVEGQYLTGVIYMGGEHSNVDIHTPIVVTGATGYLGENIIKLLLQNNYHVKGTVKDLDDKGSFQHIRLLPNSTNLQLTQAQLMEESCWDKVFEGVDYVIHVASPDPPFIPEDEEKLIQPSLAGVTNVMMAAIRQKVRRVIYTSSATTLNQYSDKNLILDETSWGTIEGNYSEPKVKILAEKKIWEVYNTQDLTKPHTQLVTLLPSMILGPLYSSHTNMSQSLVNAIFQGDFKGIPTPEILVNMVDVRDVAEAHCLALKKENLDGHRITVSSGAVSYSDIFSWIQYEFPKAPIPTKAASVQKITDEGPESLKRLMYSMSQYEQLNNQKGIQLLGVKYQSPKDTVLTMAHDLTKLGIVKYQ